MSWYKKSQDEFSGNCGMYAIALGKYYQSLGHQVVMVVASNESSDDELLYGEPIIYHIAVEIDGKLYDCSGEITLQQLASYSTLYGHNKAHIGYFELDEAFISLVRNQTNWSIPWEYFYAQIKQS